MTDRPPPPAFLLPPSLPPSLPSPSPQEDLFPLPICSLPPSLPCAPSPCRSGSLFSGLEPSAQDGRSVLAVCALSVIFLAFSSI